MAADSSLPQRARGRLVVCDRASLHRAELGRVHRCAQLQNGHREQARNLLRCHISVGVVLAENALPVAPPTTLPPAVSAVATTAMQPGPSMPPAPPAPTAAPSTRVGLMSLKLMREKGVISQAEYDDAIKDLGETTGAQTPSQESVVFGRWATTVYGFLAVDMILDSTRSLTEATGGTLIAQGRTPAGDNARMTMSVRYTRFGLRMKAPQFGQVMTSATLEGDFLGNQPAVQTGPYPAASWFDVNLFTDPAPGIRFGLE